jgi:two-component system, cell cycle sensor histidine kinase and response regulator CckA
MGTILVADDEAAIRTLLKSVLTLAGHSVYEASNGLETVAVYRSYASKIDLIVIDMMMPVMNGAQAIARIRETNRDIPIICISGFSDSQIPGGAAFLLKPFTPRKLLDLASKLMES